MSRPSVNGVPAWPSDEQDPWFDGSSLIAAACTPELLADLSGFMRRLAALPVGKWPTFGMLTANDAEAILDAVVANRGLSLAAWYVRDQVDTLAELRRPHDDAHQSRTARRVRDAAIARAKLAAVALLVRPYLAPRDFAVLYGPFTQAPSEPREQDELRC